MLQAASTVGPPRLRKAESGDTDFLRRLFASTRGLELEALGADSPLAASFVAMQLAARERSYRSAHPSAVCQIVEPVSNGRPEAIGQLWVDISPGLISLLDISLLPRWRGLGVGSALLRDVLADARALQRPVQLNVELTNPARRLYERLGFEDVGVDGLHRVMHWQPRPATNL